MLSSQTKDEVTDAAVNKLRQVVGGTLSLEAVLAADDAIVSEAINKVGFWRRKTQFSAFLPSTLLPSSCPILPSYLFFVPLIPPSCLRLSALRALYFYYPAVLMLSLPFNERCTIVGTSNKAPNACVILSTLTYPRRSTNCVHYRAWDRRWRSCVCSLRGSCA